MSTDEIAFPTLAPAQIAVLDALGSRRRVTPGDYLYREGDATYDLYVVASGAVEITIGPVGNQRVIARHGPGNFLGELNLLTGLRVFVSARVTEPGEVIVVPAVEFRRMAATQPALSDTILGAFIARRAILVTGAATAIRVIGSRFSPETARIREFLARGGIPHEMLDSDRDQAVDTILREFTIEPDQLPVVIVSGRVLRKATAGGLAQHLGLTVDSLPERCFDLLIIGAGPAGLAAAVYGASEGLQTLGLDMAGIGGQAGASSRIENYLGFPLGISGGDLTRRAYVQAKRFGAQLTAPCAAVSVGEHAGHAVVTLQDGTQVVGRAMIIAAGARYRRIDAKRLDDFETTSVYYGATDAEARQCAGSPVVVTGGGNSAGQAALFLARSSPVTVVIRGPDLGHSMSRYLVDRIGTDPGIDVRTQTHITALEGGDGELRALAIVDRDGEAQLPCAALFSFIGADPNSSWLSGYVALDDQGFVLTDRSLTRKHLGHAWATIGRQPLPYETSRPGVFAVGDVRAGSIKRVAAAVGEGSAAVRSIHEYLSFAH